MAEKKRICAVLLLLLLCVAISGCTWRRDTGEAEEEANTGPRIVEVKITGANFYDYFDYKEYPSYATDEDGVINACNLSYGFSLREGFTAANDPEHKDTLQVSFTAEGISSYGEFDVDFQTLRYTGTAWSEEREQISQTLGFWPQGNRTVSFPYGTISTSYIIKLYNFTVTGVGGSIFLRVG